MALRAKAGDKAPDFTLPDADLNPQSLKEFLGKKIVLAFHVCAFTHRCTKESCDFRDSMFRLINNETQIVGISVNCPFKNKLYAEKNRLPFPILSDEDGKVTKAYGVEPLDLPCHEDCKALNKTIMLLDPEGIIRYVWDSNDPECEPNYEEIEKVCKLIDYLPHPLINKHPTEKPKGKITVNESDENYVEA
ncbi:MAG: redoxin domain-containing protein [Candidatus Bathyarchaeia archaeon]|jgi:peroxiredoxin Q/BCP